MEKMPVVKATLSSGKTVYLRYPKIRDTETAAQMVAQRAGSNISVMGLMMQRALVQLLLVQIDDKKITEAEKENMDALMSLPEYNQVLKVVEKMSGGDDQGKEPTIEMVGSEA